MPTNVLTLLLFSFSAIVKATGTALIASFFIINLDSFTLLKLETHH